MLWKSAIFLTLVHSLFLNIYASNIDAFSSSNLSPSDYLFGSNGKLKDPVFDTYRTVDLGLEIGIDSDCGRINIRNTMRSALKNIFDSKYLEDMGRDILAASPMLFTCYMSPTWCAILKHAQLRANFLAQLRLDQCKAINRFVDNRVSDFYEERSNCIQKSIRKNNGDFEQAMEGCKNHAEFDLVDWAGSGKKNPVNKLIESTAKWAGMTDKDSTRVVDLTKAFIGDSIIKQGEVRIDYGPREVQLTPRTYLMEVKNATFQKLCQDLLPKLIGSGGYKTNVYKVISEDDLKEVSGSNKITIDHQTMLSLAYLPYKKRMMACRKLSDALSLGTFSEDMAKTLDFISSKMITNPHLPEKRKQEADLKRRAFKDHVELTLTLEEFNSDPLNTVLYQINKEGEQYIGKASKREIENDGESIQNRQVENIFFDGADGVSKR